MKKRVLALLLVLAVGSIYADKGDPAIPSPTSRVTIAVTPNFTVPIGAESRNWFAVGGGATLSGRFRLPFFPLLYAGVDLGYSWVPIAGVTSMSLVQAGASTGIHYDILPALAFRGFGSAGYSYALLASGAGGGGEPFVSAGAELSWSLMPALSLAVGAKIRYFFDLYADVAGTLGISYNLLEGGSRAEQPPIQLPEPLETGSKGVTIEKISLESIFPILHIYYDSNPIGTLLLKNREAGTVTEVSVTLIVRQFMDAGKQCAVLEDLKPGEERRVNLYALFKNNVFEIKQSTKVPAEITVSYRLNGKLQTLNRVETIRIYDRNAMTWDDTNKAAAFVMPKEPAVLMLSNQINACVKPKLNRAIDPNLQSAIALHEALRLLGIAYVSPPLSSYAEVSKDKLAVDSVKFPLETIQFRSGDCSDLSILYSSLLESVQVETAFITIPGHIFMAFALACNEEIARKTFSREDEFIFRDGKVWVPVEVTERQASFLAAWQMGAREWRENVDKKQADFHPVRQAWHTYEPVNYPGIGSQPPLPDQEKTVAGFQDVLQQLVAREIYDKETALLAEIAKNKNNSRTLNALGVLYARYDLADKAEARFQAAVSKGEYVPSLLNLGNLRLRAKRTEEALSFYQRASKAAPHDPTVLLGLARCNHELQNFGLVKTIYDELKTQSPELAAQFAYLRLQGEEATRAAEANQMKDFMVWGEEK